MKQVILAAITIMFAANISAQILPVKLYEYTSKLTAAGGIDVKPGKELTTLQVPLGNDALQLFIYFDITDYKKLSVERGLHLIVASKGSTDGNNAFDWYWKPLTKNAPIYTNYTFAAGDYTISLVDNDKPEKVFATRTITVLPNAAKAANTADGFRYDRSHFKIWTCASVDETSWKPIGATNKIKAGSCITLFFESKDKLKNEGPMRWGIYRVEADGTETIVSQKDQGISLEKWSKLYVEEWDEFSAKGKYRIYIATKYDSDSHYNVNGNHYFAKTDLEVE
jgi:hypothetical protein